MRLPLLLAASGLALTAAACTQAPPPRATLECPAARGDLTRTSVAADGKTCTYVTSSGADVTLQLVSVQGGVDGTLASVENTLMAGRQADAADAKDVKGAKGDSEDSAKAADKTAAAAEKDADKARKEAAEDAHGADVSLENGHVGVSTHDHGATHVNLPGIHITADDDNDTAHVQVGPININAGEGKATVRMKHDVRLRGEALNPQKRGFRAMFLYHGDDLPEGYRYVGYEAGGPKTGPIVVAVVKSKSADADGGRIQSDITKLVRLNGGV
ncbi:MAG: hypothetical protein JF588_24015 [Caulobacterales bacterium]|nr:hypothetical protein [Caulobacterales bacterium]